jgi:hypothetical protein
MVYLHHTPATTGKRRLLLLSVRPENGNLDRAAAYRPYTSITGRALIRVVILVIELMSFPSCLTMNILSMYCFEYPVRICVELFC